MTSYKVEFTEEAWAAVHLHARFIANDRRAPVNAARWLARLLTATDSLERLPVRFAVDPDESAAGGTDVHRMVFERTYLVFYTVDDPTLEVTIVSFRHGARLGNP